MSKWIKHNGKGRPVPAGTIIDVIRFNGSKVENITAGGGPTVDPQGNVVSPRRARWSAWDHFDGGPMAVKYRAYRVRQKSDRFAAQMEALRSFLTIRAEELA